MNVYKLTTEQKDLLIGQAYDEVQLFNPTLDAESNWFISIEEVNNCTNEYYQWVKELPIITYNPIIYERF